jgi:hypothetical protein
MTTRWLPAHFSSRPELRPARALLNPAWLFALAILALNDHLWKGGGVLPGAVTGKLSDVAGLFLAPALMAALLGVRSRRGLLFCSAAVGLVFSSINLSPACADAWSWLMGLVGFPWKITVDPTDLLTLPAIALGWRVLVPAMASAPRPRTRLHPAELGAAAVGTLLCVATSDDGGPPMDPNWGETGWQPITADVYLHNASDDTITVRLRGLRADVLVDCTNAADDPGRYFTDAVFDEGATWVLPPRTNGAARPLADAAGAVTNECYAVLLESDTLDPTVLFWRSSDIALEQIPGSTADGSHFPGAVILTSDADHRVTVDGSERDVVFPRLPPEEGAVLPQPDIARVAWSEAPLGSHEITALDLGADGCLGVTFDEGAVPRWYLCVPEDSFTFAPGQWVDITASETFVELQLAASENDPDPGDRRFVASRGGALPNLPSATLAAAHDFGVPLAPDPVCGTVARPQTISVGWSGEVTELGVGESATFADGTAALTVWAVHAERRIILDPLCAEGPDQLGSDLEVVASWQKQQ